MGPAPATLLRLMWLASPALPVGGFSYSEGLESAVDQGRVDSESTAGDWLMDQLVLTVGRSDLPLVAQAFRAWTAADAGRIADLNDWQVQTRETAELRAQSGQMGRSLLDWLRNGSDAADPRLPLLAALRPAPTWPIAFALAGVLAQADESDTLLAFAWGWAENMAQAAMKAVPLGQAAAQRLLDRLRVDLPALCAEAARMGDDDRVAFTPMLAILSAQHESQYSRLFRS